MTRPRISAKAERFTESVIREMNRLAVAAGAVSLAQGFPDFPCPPELKAAAAAAVNDDLNQYAITWGSKPLRDAIAASTPRHFPGWGADRPRDPGHRHLRRDRGDDRRDARAARPGRRDRRLRAVLRELRPGRDPGRRGPALRDAPRARLVDRSRRAARGVRAADPRHRRQLAAQPDRQGLLADRARADRRAVHRVRRHRLHRRHLRAHRVRGRAHPARDAPRDGRADRVDPLDVEVVLGHRLADRLDDRPARPVARDPAGPRLPDRRGGRAAPGRGGRRARVPRRLLRRPRRRLPRPARPAPAGPARGRLPDPRAGRRLLRHDRHRRPRGRARTTSPSRCG